MNIIRFCKRQDLESHEMREEDKEDAGLRSISRAQTNSLECHFNRRRVAPSDVRDYNGAGLASGRGAPSDQLHVMPFLCSNAIGNHVTVTTVTRPLVFVPACVFSTCSHTFALNVDIQPRRTRRHASVIWRERASFACRTSRGGIESSFLSNTPPAQHSLCKTSRSSGLISQPLMLIKEGERRNACHSSIVCNCYSAHNKMEECVCASCLCACASASGIVERWCPEDSVD